jgi:two-component system, LytTR family, response regulator
VLYCDSVRSYTNFFLLDGKQLMVSKGAKECEELLTDFKFIRINQSQIINPKYIKSYTRGRGGDLTLINGTTLEVSRDKKKDLLDHFRKL